MKTMLMVLAVMVSGLVSAQLQAPIDVPPVTVTKHVEVVDVAVKPAVVEVRAIIILFDAQGSATVNVNWAWKDSEGNILKQGTRRFTEAEIAPMLEANGANIAALKALFAGIAKADAEAPSSGQQD